MTDLLASSTLTLKSGANIRIATLGTGTPVVLTHGYPDNLQIWSRVAPLLARYFTVHAFDWPGLGHSEAVNGGATPYHLAAQIEEVLDAIQVEKSHVVGLDMGGQPALAFAARYPNRVLRTVVSNSLVISDAPTSLDIRIMRNLDWNARVLHHMHRVIFERAKLTFLPRGSPLTAEVRRDLWTGFSRAETRDRLIKMCAGYQAALPRIRRDYETISTPVMALWGSGDVHFPIAQVDALAERIPILKRQILDAPHWMAWSHAEEVAGHIQDFLQAPPQGA